MFKVDSIMIWRAQLRQSCPALCDAMDRSPPGSSVHRILLARILERVFITSSKGSSWPRDWTCVSCIAGNCFTTEPSGKPEGGGQGHKRCPWRGQDYNRGYAGKRLRHPERSLREPSVGECEPGISEEQTICIHYGRLLPRPHPW